MRIRKSSYATAGQTFDVDSLLEEIGLGGSGRGRQPRLVANDVERLTGDHGMRVRSLPSAA